MKCSLISSHVCYDVHQDVQVLDPSCPAQLRLMRTQLEACDACVLALVEGCRGEEKVWCRHNKGD